MKKNGGAATTISIPYTDTTDPTKVTQDIQGALKVDPSIEGVFVFGSSVAENAKQMNAVRRKRRCRLTDFGRGRVVVVTRVA